MIKINRTAIISFIVGAILSPMVLSGGFYLYIKFRMTDSIDSELSPPDIPVSDAVSYDLDVRTLDGREMNLDSELKNEIVFLNFWATWCPPCVMEMPSIEKLYQRFKGKIIFACVSNEKVSKLKEFNDKKAYTFPIYHLRGEAPEVFYSRSIPTTFIISKDGLVALKHQGSADWAHEKTIEFLEKLIEKNG